MSDGHEIPLSVAAAMTQAYRDASMNPIIAAAFNADAINRILNQEYCVGIRCYYALTTRDSHPEPNAQGNLTLVLVGYDASGNDIVSGELAELANLCPHECSSENALNS